MCEAHFRGLEFRITCKNCKNENKIKKNLEGLWMRASFDKK